MLKGDFCGQFGPEQFSNEHMVKLIGDEIKAKGRFKRFFGIKSEEMDQRLTNTVRYVLCVFCINSSY